MKQILRITVLLLLAVLTAGQAHALRGSYAISQGTVSGGEIVFFADEDMSGSVITAATAATTVYINALPDATHSGLRVAFTVTKSGPSSQAESRTRSPQVATVEVSAVSGKPGMYSFTMPDEGSNVVVSAEFPDKPYLGDGTHEHIKYLNDKQEPVSTSALLEAGTKVYILDGTEDITNISGWYAVTSSVTYTGGLTLTGNTHLILADGATMNVGNTEQTRNSSSYKVGIYATGDFTVYGQEKCTGTLNVKATDNDYAIYAYQKNITFNSGKVDAKAQSDIGIFCYNGDITINGGEVTASAPTEPGLNASNITINGGNVNANGSNGLRANASLSITGGKVDATGIYYAIYSGNELTISGGQVKSSGNNFSGNVSIYSDNGSIHLGWTNADDYIYATGYFADSGKTVSVDATAGQRFVAWTPAATEGGAEEASSIVGSGSIDDLTAVEGKVLRPLAVAETGTDGKVTTSPSYVVTTPAGLTLSDKTDADGDPQPDFTITTGTGTSAVTTPYYIYKAGADVSIITNDYGHTGVEISSTPALTTVAVSQDHTQATFQMPAQDVTVSGMKFYAEDVEYYDWNSTTKALETKTAAKAYILTGGGATTLPGDWYVVTNWNTAADKDTPSPDATYTGQLTFTGATHLILADDAEMSIDNQGSDVGIYVTNGDAATLDIYGQEESSGALKAKSGSHDAIFLTSSNSASTASLTINGGKVSATPGNGFDGIYVNAYDNGTASVTVNGGEVAASGKNAIYAYCYSGNVSVTINGGQVEAIGNSYGIYTYSPYGTASVSITSGKVTAKDGDYGILTASNGSATSSAVTITGGQVEASGNQKGIYNHDGDITLSLTSNGEYIMANSYGAYGSVKIPAGKALAYTFGDATPLIMGSTTADYIFNAEGNATLGAIEGMTLVYATTVPLGSGTDYYEAYCSTDGDYKLLDGVRAYAVTSYDLATKSVTLSERPLEGLAKEVPLILMKDPNGDGSPDGTLSATLTLIGTTAGEVTTIEGSVPTNISPMFIAGNGTSTMAELISTATSGTADDYMVFVLKGDKFTPATFSAESVPAKGLCFLIVSKVDVLRMLNGSTNPPAAGTRAIAFDLGNTTGIVGVCSDGIETPAEWYDLQGRRLSSDTRPTAKGIYIQRGRKIVIK